MRVLIITGSHPRHNYFIASVRQHLEPEGYIICEREAMIPPAPPTLTPYLTELWQTHFSKRDAAETSFFGESGREFSAENVLKIPADQLNADATIDWYLDQKPFDMVLLSGCPIVKDPFYGMLPAWTVNAHLGLIPYFKGTMSPFWTHYLLKPNWNGCTYHVIGRHVDTGMIIHQTQAKLHYEDGVHEAACRNYVTMCNDVEKVLRFVNAALVYDNVPEPDPSLARKGMLFTNADWHAGLLMALYTTFSDRVCAYFLDRLIPQAAWPKLISL